MSRLQNLSRISLLVACAPLGMSAAVTGFVAAPPSRRQPCRTRNVSPSNSYHRYPQQTIVMGLIVSRLPERKAGCSSWVRREKWSSAAFLAPLDDALPSAAPVLAQGALASVLFFALYASLARKWILTEDGVDGGGGGDDEQARGEDDGRDGPDDASLRTKVYVFCFAASVVSAGLLAPATTATASPAATFESLLVGALVAAAAAASAASATGFESTSAAPASSRTRTKSETPAGAEFSATPTGAGDLGEDDDGDDEATAAWRSAEQALLERWDAELRGRPSSDPRRPP
jgi:hypothetical protein